MIYSVNVLKTNSTGFDSLKYTNGAKHQQSLLLVFFCAVLARLYKFMGGASADALKRAGFSIGYQSVNPLATRPPYLTVGKAGLFNKPMEVLNNEYE